MRFMCHCAAHEHAIFRKFFGKDDRIRDAVETKWKAGLVSFREGITEEVREGISEIMYNKMVDYDSRADKVNRDGGWLSYPIPRAHGMMLRSDARSWRNDKVCRADLFHPDRPQYYISEREYFELKRQQLDKM